MFPQTAEYALRAAVFLASREENSPASAHEIAEETKVPVGYLQKILRMMARRGLLTAQRGSGGGFALAKVASAISVLDILEATETALPRIERCPLGLPGHANLCSLHRLIDQESARMRQTFAATSLADLAADRDGVRPLCAPQAVHQTAPTMDGSKQRARTDKLDSDGTKTEPE